MDLKTTMSLVVCPVRRSTYLQREYNRFYSPFHSETEVGVQGIDKR